jgi:hypothetical protein
MSLREELRLRYAAAAKDFDAARLPQYLTEPLRIRLSLKKHEPGKGDISGPAENIPDMQYRAGHSVDLFAVCFNTTKPNYPGPAAKYLRDVAESLLPGRSGFPRQTFCVSARAFGASDTEQLVMARERAPCVAPRLCHPEANILPPEM